MNQVSKLIRCAIWVFVTLVTALAALPSTAGETVTYYYTNEQGTPLATANAAGALSTSLDYRPFGTQALGSPSQGPGYTGHVNDAETGLVYMQARFYDPEIGRFVSIDPASWTPGDAFGFNRFAYVNNNPVGNVDPTGRESACVTQAGHCDTSRLKEPTIGDGIADVAKAAAKYVINADSAFHKGEDGDPLKASNDTQSATMVTLDAVTVTALMVATDDEAIPMQGGGKSLGDSALVCRGGLCQAQSFTAGTGVQLVDGKLTNVSVNSSPGGSLKDLSSTVRNGQVGVTTVGQVRAAGGDVIPSPTASNPNHCTLCGITPEKAQELFTPTVGNPNK